MKENPRKAALGSIFQAALAAVEPETVVLRSLKLRGDRLQAGERQYNLSRFKGTFLVSVGKAGVAMGRAVLRVLGSRLTAGMVVAPRENCEAIDGLDVFEAGHPEPDEAGLKAGQAVIAFLEKNLGSRDLLLLAISGGGSALLPNPVAEISFQETLSTNALLLRCGANIQEINAVRKHLSRVKGGRLIEFTQGATVLCLLLSDVVGDDVSSIASGPTAPDPTTFQDCLNILRNYQIDLRVPPAVLNYLQQGATEDSGPAETPKPGDPRFERVESCLVATNLMALKAAARAAHQLGFKPLVLSSAMQGNPADLARFLAATSLEVIKSGHPLPAPCCLICGGETTVVVRGDGLGGRNQEMALWFALQAENWGRLPILFASLATDGIDGFTKAAGAWSDPTTASIARSQGLSLREHLRRNDSYNFFRQMGNLIVTGPTGTNVMDLQLVLIG